MRTRIKFAKFDTMRFIGHLDVMRYFVRLLNRTGLPVKYSEGYHPHQIMSFAQPLGLGVTSDGEYVDIEFDEELDCELIKNKMNECISHGFLINEVVRLADRELNKRIITAMSLINRSVYYIALKDEVSCTFSCDEYFSKLKEYLQKESLNVIKKTKKGEKEVNLKDYIYEVYTANSRLDELYIYDEYPTIVTDEMFENCIVHAPDIDNKYKIVISLSCGSETNIAPDFFMESFLNSTDFNITADDFRYHRMELSGGEKGSVSLCKIL